jgi:hypothetical protein
MVQLQEPLSKSTTGISLLFPILAGFLSYPFNHILLKKGGRSEENERERILATASTEGGGNAPSERY